MDLKRINEVLESFCKPESTSNVQKLKNDKNLVNGIIQNLPEHYAHQLSDPVYSSLFELYRRGGKAGQQFVLQFVPVLVWTYLSAKARRDEQAYGKLEALLLAIYNADVLDDAGEQKIYKFRMPSLSRPSIYHEPYQGSTTSSTLTEMALSRHEQSETVVALPGPGMQLNRITAAHRLSVLSAVLYQYNANIVFMTEASQHSFCIMALKLAKCGFYKLCRPSKEESKEKSSLCFTSEELTKLVNHPRVPLSTELIQEMTHGLYFLMYNGQRIIASKALEDLHWRAAHSLLAPAHMLTNAIKHSLDQTAGLPHNGPLGLEMYLSDQKSHANQPVSVAKTVPTVSGMTLEPPVKTTNIVAMTTKGMEMTRPAHAAPNESAVETADVEIRINPRKHSASSADQPAKETKKTHKKSQSTGYFKLPFLTQKGDLELQPISGVGGNSSETRRFSSEINIGSNRTDSVELIASSFSDEVLDHRL